MVECKGMAMPAKKERNRKLVSLRRLNPKKYSWRNLGKEFNIKHTTARDIFMKENARV